jgi:hypothetical protein
VGDFYLQRIKNLLGAAEGDEQLFEAIVNAPFHDKIRVTNLDLGIIVFLLVNKSEGTIDRVALSNTEQAAGAVKMSEKPFKEIIIPLGYEGNLIATAIQTGQIQKVADWKYLFAPALSPRAARFNQAGAGIEFSLVHPLKARDGGALIFSFYQVSTSVGDRHYAFVQKYSKLVDQFLDNQG